MWTALVLICHVSAIEQFKSLPIEDVIIPAGMCYTTPSPRPVETEFLCHALAYSFGQIMLESKKTPNYDIVDYKCVEWDLGYLGPSI